MEQQPSSRYQQRFEVRLERTFNFISQIVVGNDFLPVTLMPLVLAGCVVIPVALRRSRNGTRNTLEQQLRDWALHPTFLSMLVVPGSFGSGSS